jgi:hypothetical protein
LPIVVQFYIVRRQETPVTSTAGVVTNLEPDKAFIIDFTDDFTKQPFHLGSCDRIVPLVVSTT